MLRRDGVEGALLVRRRVQVVEAVRDFVHRCVAAGRRGRRPHFDAAAVLDLFGDVVRIVAEEVEELESRVAPEVGLDEPPDLDGNSIENIWLEFWLEKTA